MSEERVLFKNVTFMILSMILPNVFNLIMVMIGARILLNSGMNDYNVVLSFVTMFILFSDIGTGGILIRDGSRDGSRISVYFGSYFITRFGVTCLAAIACLLASGFMPYSSEIKGYIVIMIISQLIFQLAQVFSTLFQARQRMEFIMYGNVLQAILFFAFGWAFISGNMGVIGLIYANLLANLAMLVLYVLVSRKDIYKIGFSLDKHVLRYLLLAGLPLGIMGYLNVIYSYVDRFILSILRYGEVANYTMPYTLVMSLSFILLAYTSSVFPTFSKIFKNSDYIRYACEASLKYLFIIIVPMCVGVTFLADRIIYTLYGYDFPGAIPVLRVLVWLLFFMIVTYMGFPLLTATHRERYPMYIMFVSSVFNIVLNVLLIPQYGALGSSWASLLTIGLLNAALTWYVLRNDLRGINIAGTFIRVLVACGAMTASLVFINLNNLPLYVIMGAFVYSVVFIAIGGITRKDADLLRRLIVKSDDSKINNVFNTASRFLRN